MKRLATQPITAFFQRKQIRRISIESIESSSNSGNEDTNSSTQHQVGDPKDSVEGTTYKKQSQKQSTTKQNVATDGAIREDLVRLLQCRELVGCATTRQLIGGIESFRRRRKQQLVRWMLVHFERLPLKLQLPSNWQQHVGVRSPEPCYTSCLEFDAGGVLLLAGASNGIISLYDFDEVFHHSLNLEQRMHNKEEKGDEKEDREQQEQIEILHPIHTIFTPFEVKRIRWNPLNDNEVACSFTNRNEIYVYNLRKFPSKPHKILKSLNHPSCGYNDLLYLTVTTMRTPKAQSKAVNVIAGDMDGAVRMWDPRFPLRPVWSFLTGSLKTPINSLLLSSDKQFLICGNEAGMIMTYDIQHKIIPAFGSKPVPQRKATINVMETMKPYLSPDLIEGVLLTSRYGSPGIMSLHLVPESEAQVVCQLRNDWVVVLDYLLGSVVKLHTFLRGSMPRDKSKSDVSPSVLSMVSESHYQRDFLPRSLRNSWLSCHRCTGTFLFDKSIMCTGIHDAKSLTLIDLHQLRSIKTATTDPKSDGNEVEAESRVLSDLPAVERVHRCRIPMNGVITAVSAHPNEHLVICGGENMTLQIMGFMGKQERAS